MFNALDFMENQSHGINFTPGTVGEPAHTANTNRKDGRVNMNSEAALGFNFENAVGNGL
jgi:hypothetical protein